jgi:tRNA-uridine 2-sulfurtransferase
MAGKGILLYSGGLDSLIAGKLLLDQGVELLGLHFILPFAAPHHDPETFDVSRMAEQIGLPLVHKRCGKEYLEMAAHPEHGYGKEMNPCIDCKIYFVREAAKYMKETGADFVATGEVVGQRPMSQLKNTMNHIHKESGLEGRLLRPLSAGILKPTIPEMEGVVDREKLLSLNGRGRKEQLRLATEMGIEKFTSPAGGCLFTDGYIAKRIKDLFDHHESYSSLDFYLLTVGRHFRISRNVKLIVSRREEETLVLDRYRDHADIFIGPRFTGPVGYVLGRAGKEEINLMASIVASYAKKGTEEFYADILSEGESEEIEIKDIVSVEDREKLLL